jgi:hypothetical protein
MHIDLIHQSKSNTMENRVQILSLYKKILRLSKTWKGPQEHKTFIRSEARELFGMNRNLVSPTDIAEKIEEAELRIQLALHYGIPQPRPYHLPSDSFVDSPPCIIPKYESTRAHKFKGHSNYKPEKTDY